MRTFLVLLIYVAIIFTCLKKSQCDQRDLPDDIEPLSYELKITPDLTSFTFIEIVTIIFRVKYSTNVLKLHCKNLEIDLTIPEEDRYRGGQTVELQWTQTDEFCIFTASRPFQIGSNYVLQIRCKGNLKDDGKGLFRTSYQVEGKKKWLVATNFYGTYAREAFPCFDEPRFKTPFKISIARNKYQRVISNMPLEEIHSHSENENLVWDTFKETPPIPTHLVAFVMSDCSGSSNKNSLIEIHTRCNALKNTQYALEQSEKMLTQLENFIGIKYDLSKVYIATVPEIRYQLTDNWGLFLMREDYLIGEDRKRSHMQNIITTASMCHLFARHWFGEQVTPATWEYSWLTEALAGFMEFFVTDLAQPSWEIKALFNVEVLQSALWSELTYPGALKSYRTSNSQINQKYGSINYYKGASIIRMLEHIISRSSLRSAIKKYITDSKKLHHGLVTSNNLFEALMYQSDIDSFPLPPHYSIIDVMKSWTENIGYPVIKVTRNSRNKMIEIEQRTYVSRQALVNPTYQKWITPISCTSKCEASFSNTAPSDWIIDDEKITLSTSSECTEWVICNLQRAGYYRVDYDSQNWNLLIEQLNTDIEKIHVLNRAQLIDDSFTFAFEGQLSYSVPLKLAKYLEKETEIVPLLSAIFHYEMLYKKYEDTSSRVFFCMCIKRILEKQIQLIGFSIKSTDSYSIKMGKPLLLLFACKIGLKICVREALLEYDANVGDISNVQPDLKQVVFCTALRESGDVEKVYNNLWATYHSTDIAYDRIVILKTFGCSRDESILKKILSKLFDQNDVDIAKVHENYVYDSILSSSFGITTTLKFARDQADRISQFNVDELETLKIIFSHLESKVHAVQHLRILRTITEKFAKLDSKKYEEFVTILDRTKISGIKRARENNKMSDHLKPIFYDVLNIHTSIVPVKLTSSAFIPVPSIFLCIICFLFGNFH